MADFFLDATEHGAPVGCLPSLEVHVDMWSEDFRRVESVAALLARSNVQLRITLDPSHLMFKIGNAEELIVSGVADDVAAGRLVLDPASPRALHRLWLREGWVAHAHARSAVPAGPVNRRMQRTDGRPGRAIQYPFIAPPAGSFDDEWRPERLEGWKLAMRQILAWKATHPKAPLSTISCEFIPFPDYGGGARYSIWDNNLACAAWLREEWAALEPRLTPPPP